MEHIKLLENHGVAVKIENSRLLAFEDAYNVLTEEDCSCWVDVTEYSHDDIMTWLGY